ncbi:MAG TPA: hypothetical protein VK176_07220 [Phycisphaerales bacterium]|nr:hypothetical protein [Phycisphaerales bacterium]
MTSLPLNITLIPGDSLHDDLVLELNDWRATGDTWWLACFAGPVELRQSDARGVLISAIAAWLDDLAAITHGSLWFPIQAADEYSRWLGVEVVGDETLALVMGRSSLEGHELNEGLACSFHSPRGWSPESSVVIAAKRDLVARFTEIRGALQAACEQG